MSTNTCLEQTQEEHIQKQVDCLIWLLSYTEIIFDWLADPGQKNTIDYKALYLLYVITACMVRNFMEKTGIWLSARLEEALNRAYHIAERENDALCMFKFKIDNEPSLWGFSYSDYSDAMKYILKEYCETDEKKNINIFNDYCYILNQFRILFKNNNIRKWKDFEGFDESVVKELIDKYICKFEIIHIKNFF